MKRRFNLKLSGAMFHRNKVAKTVFVPLRVLRIQALLCSSSQFVRFSEVSETFRARKDVFVSCVYIQNQGFNSSEGNTTQLSSVYGTKWTGL